MKSRLSLPLLLGFFLLATGDLILKPNHHGETNPPPEWKYYDIWMQIREELRKTSMQKPAR